MATLDVRKLLCPGTGSRSVIIPRSWADYYGLRKGDDVYVLTNDQFVLVCPTNIDSDKVKRIFLEMCQRYHAVEHDDGKKPEVVPSTASAASPGS